MSLCSGRVRGQNSRTRGTYAMNLEEEEEGKLSSFLEYSRM